MSKVAQQTAQMNVNLSQHGKAMQDLAESMKAVFESMEAGATKVMEAVDQSGKKAQKQADQQINNAEEIAEKTLSAKEKATARLNSLAQAHIDEEEEFNQRRLKMLQEQIDNMEDLTDAYRIFGNEIKRRAKDSTLFAAGLGAATGALSGLKQGFTNVLAIGKGFFNFASGVVDSLFNIAAAIISIPFKMFDGLIKMAEGGQVVILTPFTLSGAMAPATVAGALTQQNAEALAGITLVQLINPGCPVIYGGFTSNVDMKTGAPAFGTPEATRAAMIGGQLARLNGVPYRSSNPNASTSADAQAAYESQMSLWGAVMGHANMILHAAGWLEGGLVASFEKFIIDVDTLQMMAEVLTPIEVTDEAIGIEAMRDVGPGGHFFGTQHTLERYETAFYEPIVSDWRNFESWEAAGAPDAQRRANTICKKVLETYQPPDLDVAIADRLSDFVARRKREIGTRTL